MWQSWPLIGIKKLVTLTLWVVVIFQQLKEKPDCSTLLIIIIIPISHLDWICELQIGGSRQIRATETKTFWRIRKGKLDVSDQAFCLLWTVNKHTVYLRYICCMEETLTCSHFSPGLQAWIALLSVGLMGDQAWNLPFFFCLCTLWLAYQLLKCVIQCEDFPNSILKKKKKISFKIPLLITVPAA